MVSSEIWLSLAKLVHCNEGAGGNRGHGGHLPPPQILDELEANHILSKGLLLLIVPPDFQTFRQL